MKYTPVIWVPRTSGESWHSQTLRSVPGKDVKDRVISGEGVEWCDSPGDKMTDNGSVTKEGITPDFFQVQ